MSSFTFDSVDMSGDSYGLAVVDYDIPEFPEVALEIHRPIHGDSEFSSVHFEAREITLECFVIGTSEADMQSKMDAVKKVCNPILGDKVLTIDADKTRRYIGRVAEMSEPSIKGAWGQRFSITFITRQHKEDIEATTGTDTIASDPESWSISSGTGNVSRLPLLVYSPNTTDSASTAPVDLATHTHSG